MPSLPDAPRPPVSRAALACVLGTSAFLGLAHAALHLWYPGRHALALPVRLLFDATSEESLSTWVSVGTQLVLGLACLLVAARERSRAWAATGALFVFLSADDEAQIHERLSWLLPDPDGVNGVYAWVVGFAPAYALVGALAFLHLGRAARGRSELRIVLAAGACLVAALVLEACEGPLARSGHTWRGFSLHAYTVPFEEALELAGPGLLLLVVSARLRLAEPGRAVRAEAQHESPPQALAPEAPSRRSDAA